MPTGPEQRECVQLPQMEQRFDCLTDLALDEGNIRYCNYIIDSGFRVTCKTLVAKDRCDPELCSDIEENWKRPVCEQAVKEWKDKGKCGQPVR